MFAFLPPCFKFIALIASEVSILDLSAVAAFHRSGGSIRLCVQHDTYRYLLTITDAFYQLSAFSLSLSLFCIVYVHRHWHVRINTQREREKTHTHTNADAYMCNWTEDAQTYEIKHAHPCMHNGRIYNNICIYIRISRCYSKFVGKLFYII